MKNKGKLPVIIREDTREKDEYTYIYRLIESPPRTIGRLTVSFYSISIEMTDGENKSESKLTDLFADVGKALAFYHSLVGNLASPIDLNYILEDKITL